MARRAIARNAKWPEIERLAKTRAPEAIQTLTDIMLDSDENGATRVSAANAILDRGYGKPKSRVDVSGSIDVNAAHLHAIKIMADQVSAESRLIASEGKPLHDISIVPVPVNGQDKNDMAKPWNHATVIARHKASLPDIFK